MEGLQYGYVEAVIAAAGCKSWAPKFDDGIDLQIDHAHAAHTLNEEQEARIQVQLKATTIPPSGGYIRAEMSVQRFRRFALPNPSLPHLVVIMHVPAAQQHWVYADERSLSLFHRAYWVNLAGQPEPLGASDRVAIKAPLTQVFDDVALCQIMMRVGSGDRP